MNTTVTKEIIHKNKKVAYDFSIIEIYEAGMVLTGTEVKVLRQKRANITDAYVAIDNNNEAFVYNINIPQYEFGNISNHQETRKRKLLLHKTQISEVYQRMKAEGLTAVPLSIYFLGRKVKLEFALVKGKKKFDKREDAAKKEIQKKIKAEFGL